jgi:hypothetical protein
MKRAGTARVPMLVLGMMLMLGGCATHAAKPTTQPAADADEATARIRTILPPGWKIVRIDRHTYPFYRRAGKGVGIYLAPPDVHQRKTEYEAAVFIMPAWYSDPGGDPTRGQAQTIPPRLIGQNAEMKVYLWFGWPDAEAQLRDVLALKSPP